VHPLEDVLDRDRCLVRGFHAQARLPHATSSRPAAIGSNPPLERLGDMAESSGGDEQIGDVAVCPPHATHRNVLDRKATAVDD
jgi:hypothetical protein